MRTSTKALVTAACVTGMGSLVMAESPRHDSPDARRDGSPDMRRSAPMEMHRDGPGPRHDEPFHGRPGNRFWRLPGPSIRIVIGDRPHYYYSGAFYVMDNNEYVVVEPPMGACVPVLPSDCSPVIAGGMTYYVSGTTYFRRFGGGYIVVTRPVMTAGNMVETPAIPDPAPQITSAGQAWTVWITNPNGSKTSVVLRAAEGGQWVGQKGEYYDGFPTEAQLLPVYGLGMADVAPAPAPVQKETIVWVKNPNGSKSKVVLKPGENGSWIGPRGEAYDTMPSEEQLRSVYGVTGAVSPDPKDETPAAAP